MWKILAVMITSILVLGLTALAHAESGTDAGLDTSRSSFASQQALTTRPVMLQYASPKPDAWMGHAGDIVGGGL